MFLIFFACLWAYASCQSCASPFDSATLYRVTNVKLNIAESPTWDPRKEMFFFVDIFNAKVYSYSYQTRALNSIDVNGLTATPILLTENSNIIVVGVNSSLIAIEWDGTNPPTKQKILTSVGPQYELPLMTAFNDGKADRNGNVWIGTTIKNFNSEDVSNGAYLDQGGTLYRISKDDLANPRVVLTNITLTNGMTWNLADDKFYYTDSVTRQVIQYDFDLENGVISNPQVVLNLNDHPDIDGVPDGITIDNDDNIWVGLYGGGSIIRVNPRTKEILRTIGLPAKHVTSGIWGGPNHDIMFVGTASRHLTDAEKRYYPIAGDVFALTDLGTTGRQAYYTNIVDSL